MGETFLININCSSILFDSEETQYTMFIDTSKISIVYELIEWIRWIFSVESCIYLTQENSVIHELEDIRVLSKLKNFEIKLCGGPVCVHKKTYRSLLSNLDLFVNWNETKVHKYFLEKLNRIKGNFVQEKTGPPNHCILTNTKLSFSENERGKNNTVILEKGYGNQLPSVNGYPLNARGSVNDNLKFEPISVSKSSSDINCFYKRKEAKENVLIHLEDGSNCSNNSNLVNVTLSSKKYSNFSPIKSPVKNKFEIDSPVSKNSTKAKSKKSSQKFIKPFSLGEILSNIRQDVEKQKEAFFKNDELSHTSKGGNVNNITASENLFGIEITNGKKRQRTRKRKKSKKKNVETKQTFSPILPTNFTPNFHIFNSGSNPKPNHIRFEAEDEDIMEIEDEFKKKIEVEGQKNNDLDTGFEKTETKKLTEDCQNASSPMIISPSESKLENFCFESTDKIIDLGGGSGDNLQLFNTGESFESINMVQSLKEKLKNTVVVNRFY